jgi:hypothetical protein
MVVVGHSQGGLLARLMVTDSGTRFWSAVTDVPFDQIEADPQTRAVIERAMFFEPLPFVTRVVFIATPHRGSFRVSFLVLRMLRRLITLPVTIKRGTEEAIAKNKALAGVDGLPNAVDNMSPSHRFVRTLSASPIAPGVSAHSIIAVKGDPPPAGQNDGVITYESAHLEGVVSEKVIYHSRHSIQSDPGTILELRRILYEHLGIPCGLDCEVPERVEAAAQKAPEAEVPASADAEDQSP